MSVSPVDTASPPITARARGALASLPTSTPRAMGKRPTRGGEAGHDDGAQARPAGPDHRLVEAQAVASQLVRVLDQEDPVGHETGRMASQHRIIVWTLGMESSFGTIFGIGPKCGMLRSR